MADLIAHVIFPHALDYAGDAVVEQRKRSLQGTASLLRQDDAGIAPVSPVRLTPQQAALLQVAERAGGGRSGAVHVLRQL